MRHILHFAQDGDTSGYFPQLARWHDRARFRMSFATLGPLEPGLRGSMESQGVDCFSCDCRGRSEYPLGLLRLARQLRRRRIEVLHTHLFDPSVVGLLAGALAGTPTRVLTRHYSDYHTRIGRRWHVRLDRLCTGLGHAGIAVSRHTADHMIGREGAPPGKVHAVLNGIDLDRVRTSAPDAADRVREEFGARGRHLLVMVGRLHPEKGYEHLFRAMAELKRRFGRSVLLLVAGTGPFRGPFEAAVRSLGIDDVVRFLGFRRDAPDLMAAADLVVLPSLAEAFGLVLTEALYLGTPVVATRVGGIPEIVADGVDGVLVPPADDRALAGAIAGLLDDPERRSRMRGAGREKVAERFRFEDMVRSYEAIYERLGARGWEAAHA